MGHALAFDTLTFAANLQEAGMEKQQAEALAKGLYDSQDRMIENLATKQDLELVKKDLEVVKQDLESKIDKLDAKFDSKIDLLRKDMEANHHHVKWMVGTTLTGVVAVLIRSFF